jgi:hypothetical protein
VYRWLRGEARDFPKIMPGAGAVARNAARTAARKRHGLKRNSQNIHLSFASTLLTTHKLARRKTD